MTGKLNQEINRGGIALGFKEQLSDKISPVETECRFVFWFKVSADLLNTNGDDLFGIVYIPSEYTSYSSDDAYREIQNEYLMFSPNYECVCLLGDFNSRTATDDNFIFIFIYRWWWPLDRGDWYCK